jgi:hypothetical protein
MLRRLVPVLILVLIGGSVAFAQQAGTTRSELMLSWRSNGYAPPGYTGRVAAAGGGTVLVIAEMLVGGRPASLTGYEVRWFVNDELYESGFGLQSISVPIAQFHQDSFDVRVEIIAAPFSTTLKNLTVPLTDPRAVIEARSSTRLRQEGNIFLATPYSFNVTNPSDLIYNWLVGGNVPLMSEDPRTLEVSFDGTPTQPLNISLSISHPQNESEGATASINVAPVVTIQ